MKHVRLYENFDLEAFMKDPESYFHDDSSPEIVEGDYVNSYRGVGQVLSMDNDFVKVQLIDGPKSIVRVPRELVTKIAKADAMQIAQALTNTRKELEVLSSDLQDYLDTMSSTDDEETKEIISGDIEASVNYLESILIDVIGLQKKDSYTTSYPQYSQLVSIIATFAHLILETTEDDEIQKRVDSILDKFYEISN
jgi:hypothetical protein